jgi:hypothetical protein
MIGHIESYNPDSQTGVVKSAEKSYTFHLDDWVAQVPPDLGDDVNFDAEETVFGSGQGSKIQVCRGAVGIVFRLYGTTPVLFGILLARHCPVGSDRCNCWLWSSLGFCRSCSAVCGSYQ